VVGRAGDGPFTGSAPYFMMVVAFDVVPNGGSGRRTGEGDVAGLRILLLGGLQVAYERVRARPDGRKSRDLLALLLLARNRSLPRDVVAEALWPSANATVSRKATRQTLWQLHQALDGDDGDRCRLVITDGEWLRINPDRQLWVDRDAYVDAVTPSASTPPAELDEAQLDQLASAARLYRGPLLEGCYEDWCLVERERLADQHLTTLDRLSVAFQLRGDHQAATRWARELLDLEPAHERTHRRLMLLYYLEDDRTRALRQYERCRSELEHGLGIAPSARTERLATAIRADHVDLPDPV
jgi:DNA-binding SARP family transcriptional activator